MSKKPMRWALRAAEDSNVTPGFPLPEQAALVIQQAAKPILVVVRIADAMSREGSKTKRMVLAKQMAEAMPAALRAMEQTEPE